MYSLPYAVELCKLWPISRNRVHKYILSHTNFGWTVLRHKKSSTQRVLNAWAKLFFVTFEVSVWLQFDTGFDSMVLCGIHGIRLMHSSFC